LLISDAFSADVTSLWVQTSWEEVREGAAADSPVKDHWTTNTHLTVIQRVSGQCEAQSDTGIRGFVRCAALGESPLKLSDIDDESRRDGDPRAFWISPSFGAFSRFGQRLANEALTGAQKRRETVSHEPIRFPVSEFEAMKRVLTQGILPSFDEAVSRLSVSDIKNGNWQHLSWHDDGWKSRIKQARLPSITPSLFTKQADLLTLSDAIPDGIAAMMDQPSTGAFVGTPAWMDGHYDSGIEGIWDIHQINVTYPKPGLVQAIARDGSITAIEISGDVVESEITFSDGCDTEGYIPIPKGRILPGYTAFDDYLAAFYVAKPLPAHKAQVTTHALSVASVDDHVGQHPYDFALPQYHDALMHDLDLNGDGVVDMAVLEIHHSQQLDTGSASEFFYFANISGHWWLVGWQDYSECGD
jgi:hypothetical protein